MGGNYADGLNAVHVGSEYDSDEVEFARAMDSYKRLRRRPYPHWSEVLAVLKSLGWRKTCPAGPLPGGRGAASEGDGRGRLNATPSPSPPAAPPPEGGGS